MVMKSGTRREARRKVDRKMESPVRMVESVQENGASLDIWSREIFPVWFSLSGG